MKFALLLPVQLQYLSEFTHLNRFVSHVHSIVKGESSPFNQTYMSTDFQYLFDVNEWSVYSGKLVVNLLRNRVVSLTRNKVVTLPRI